MLANLMIAGLAVAASVLADDGTECLLQVSSVKKSPFYMFSSLGWKQITQHDLTCFFTGFVRFAVMKDF
jgi:hypothetical protein